MFFAATAVTFSEKFSTMLSFWPTPTALSAGVDDESVGGSASAVVKLNAVEEEIPA